MHFAIGAAGVDVFFVVSGFIMMAISDHRQTSPFIFLKNRLLRIAPNYWIVTGIMIIGAVAGLFPNMKLDFFHIMGSFFFFPVASPNAEQFWPVLVQGWTLNYEAFFYAVFAMALFFRPPYRLATLMLVLLALVFCGMFLQSSANTATFYTRPLLLEFAAGAALAKLWKRGTLPSAAIGTLLIVLAVFGFAMIHVMKLEFDARNCGPLAVMMLAGVLAIERAGKLSRYPIASYLGDASYSIYLWHTLALSVTVKLGMIMDLPFVLIATGGVIAGTFTGVIAYECVEKPIQALIKGGRLTPGRSPVQSVSR